MNLRSLASNLTLPGGRNDPDDVAARAVGAVDCNALTAGDGLVGLRWGP